MNNLKIDTNTTKNSDFTNDLGNDPIIEKNAIIVTNKDGQINYLNKTAEELTGWKLDEVLYKKSCEILKLIYESDHKVKPDPVLEIIETNSAIPKQNNTILISRNDLKYQIEYKASPKFKDDELNKIIITFKKLNDVPNDIPDTISDENTDKVESIIEEQPSTLKVEEVLSENTEEIESINIDNHYDNNSISRAEVTEEKNLRIDDESIEISLDEIDSNETEETKEEINEKQDFKSHITQTEKISNDESNNIEGQLQSKEPDLEELGIKNDEGFDNQEVDVNSQVINNLDIKSEESEKQLNYDSEKSSHSDKSSQINLDTSIPDVTKENKYDLLIEQSTNDLNKVSNEITPEQDLNNNIEINSDTDEVSKINLDSQTHEVSTENHNELKNEYTGDEINTLIEENVKLRKQLEEFEANETVKTDLENQKNNKLENFRLLTKGISHDLNNFFTPILGNLGLIKMTIDPKDKNYERIIKSEISCLKAVNLINQLSMFTEDKSLKIETLPIAATVKSSLELALAGSNIELEFETDYKLNPVNIDKKKMSHALYNIIANSKEAMGDRGILKVAISSASGEQIEELTNNTTTDYVKIEFIDNGKGISQDDLNYIFDPYFTTKENRSGLGLTIAYKIIKDHDGLINIESKLNEGSKTTVYLPSTNEETAFADPSRTEASLAASKQENKIIVPKTPLILFMDDNMFINETVSEMIHELGMKIEVANNGIEAVKLYENAYKSSNPFDLVILDLTISSGLGAEETIKALKMLDPDVKAIVSSGSPNHPVIQNFEEYGFRNAIEKPFEINDIKRIINETLNTQYPV